MISDNDIDYLAHQDLETAEKTEKTPKRRRKGWKGIGGMPPGSISQ
jgi:hypothetical protein